MKTSSPSSMLLAVFIGIGDISPTAAFTPLNVVPSMTTPATSFATACYVTSSDPRDKGVLKSDTSSEKWSNSFLPFQSNAFPGDYIISNNSDRKWIPGAENGWPDVLAPSIFAISTAALIVITNAFSDMLVNVEPTIGLMALLLVTGTLAWDKIIISLGSVFFRDVESNETKYKLLEALSFPRFISHSLFLPLQCITVAEMGKYAGLGFLQNDLVQAAIVVGAFAVAIEESTDFVRTNALTLTMWEDSPPDALERDIVKFTYEDPKFKYVIPAIVVSLTTLGVGIVTLFTDAENMELAIWLIFAASTTLIGNSGKQSTFTGNLGEICMQFGFLEAARIVYFHGF